jgi:hypothetical protein
VNPAIIDLFRRATAEAPAGYDVFLVMNLGEKDLKRPEGTEVFGERLYLTNHARLLSLPYPEKCRAEGWSGDGWNFNDGNVELVALVFHHDHSEYDYCWVMEYDVHYEGRWGFLFERFERSKGDLLATMVFDATATPHKLDMMPPFRDETGKKPPPEEAIISFLPLHRISRRLLDALDAGYRQGWNGHYEFVLATLAKRLGYEVEDIGGVGPYVRPHNRNVFYFSNVKRWDMSPGTFVFRPSFTKARRYPDTLWHPLKPSDPYFNHCPAKEENNLYGWTKFISKFVWYRTAMTLWHLFRHRPAAFTPVPDDAYSENKNGGRHP